MQPPFLLFGLIIGVLALAGGPLGRAAVGDTPRQEVMLTAGWKFHKGQVEQASAATFDDATWEAVTLPHTWNAQDGQVGGGDYYRGDGWYRRHFRVEESWAERQVYLQFDGANRSAEVFLNGRRLGAHRGGFARFRFDATAAINFTGDNVLAVRVNNRTDDNMIPVSGDFTFFGGLYRGVSLVATERVHIDLLDYASPGVYVRPSKVSAKSAELDVRMKLANDSCAACNVGVRVTILDATGWPVQVAETEVSLAAQARGEARKQLVLVQPRLWNGQADPYLYQVRTEVFEGGAVRDSVTLPLGLRFFSVDLERGFSLNGHYLDLRGVNRHQDRWDKGWAISEADEREDFEMIREMGCTAVRTSHYQQSQLWYDLGDEQGVVMWAELAFVNDVRDNPEFFANAKEQLRELIRQNYHHPSICFWSVGNETFVRDRHVTPADTNDRLIVELAAVAKEEDDTRLSTYASNGHVGEPRASHTDVIGFNHYFGWYHDAPEDFARWVDTQHASRPDLRISMSEFGAGANIAQHELPAHRPEAGGPWHPEEWQAVYHEVYWQAMAARPWLWGKFIWCMFDFASDRRNEGSTPGRNDKGLVTADRKTRKDAFYWYKANWSDQPVLHITSRRFTKRTQAVTTVKVYSNAETVELRVNGVLRGRKTSTNHIFLWPDVDLAKGENQITVSARRDGHELEDQCVWIYSPQTNALP
ncbi:MAG: glycoside hydrolase family 2 TIM barrel-domain containing protein [Opitutaceae bacterium]|jgi:beta-galactosidase